MPDALPEDPALKDLPELKADLEETRQLLDRLKGRKGETDPDRYERLAGRYRDKIDRLEPEVERLVEKGETRKMELEDRLVHQRSRVKEAEAELEEINQLHEEGAMDEEAYRQERHRHRKQKSNAQKKASQIERELDEVEFYLTETGEVSYQREKLQGQLSGASSRARQWGERVWRHLNEWTKGAGIPRSWMLGGGGVLAVLALFTVLWAWGTLEQEDGSPMFRGGPARTGVYATSGPNGDPIERWSFSTGAAVYSSPAVVGGTVYFGSFDDNLYTVGVETGQEQWSFKAGENGVYASPAVVGGTVYFGGTDGNLYAVGAETGQERWSFKAGGAVYSSPAVAGGTVYFGSEDGNLYAVSAEAGQEQWSFDTGGEISSSPAVVGGTVYFGSEDGNLYAVGAEAGQEQWSFDTGGEISSSPAVVGGTVYFGSEDGNLYAISAEAGQEQWSFNTGGEISSSPAVVGGTVYFGGTDGKMYTLRSESSGDESTVAEGPSSDEAASMPDGAPSKEVLRKAIIGLIEEGEVPEAVKRTMSGSCGDGNVKNLTIRAVGRESKLFGKTYWPVKVLVTGSCTQNFNCGPDNIMGECETFTFERKKVEFGVRQDPYGDWVARALRR